MAAVKVGDTVAHFAAPFVPMGEVESLSQRYSHQVAVITWSEAGDPRRMEFLLDQLVPATDPDGACCGLIPGDL
jgi:hypothetical protein